MLAGVALQIAAQIAVGFLELVQLFHNVDGQANGAGIVGDGAGNALANPPVGVGRKLIAFVGIKFFGGAVQTQRPLLNEI